MSDTPETDAEKFYSDHHGYYVVFAEHAEDLERERDEWKEVAEGSLLGAIKERDEALFDLDFRRDLFKLQESQLNEIRKRLAEARKRVGWLAGRPQQTCC